MATSYPVGDRPGEQLTDNKADHERRERELHRRGRRRQAFRDVDERGQVYVRTQWARRGQQRERR